MQAEGQSKSSASGRGRSRRRIVKAALIILVGLILLVFFVVPVYVSSESGRAMILKKINRKVTGRTDFAELSMGWFKGIRLADFSYVDESGNTSVSIKRILTKPFYGSIIFGNLAFGRTIVDEPVVKMNVPEASSNRGGESAGRAEEEKKATGFVLPVERIDLVVNNGNVQVNVASAPGQAGRLELAQINSSLNLRGPGRQTDFALDMKVAGTEKASRIKAEGQIKPAEKRGWSLSGTSGDFVIEVDGLELASLGPFFAAAKMEVEAQGSFSTVTKLTLEQGRPTKIDSQMSAAAVRIESPQLKGGSFVADKLEAGAKLESKDELVEIDNIDIKTDWLNIEASGVVPKTIGTLEDLLKPDSAHSLTARFDCDLAAAGAVMPRGIGLKEEVQITSGRLEGSVQTYTDRGRREILAEATVTDLEGVVEGKTVALSAPVVVEAKTISDKAANHAGFTTRLDKLDISASFGKVHCAGLLGELDYTAEIDLAALQADLGGFVDIGQRRMEGVLAGSGNISISKDKVITSGSSTVSEFRLTSAEGVTAKEPSANISYRVVVDLERDTLNIEQLEMSGGFGDVSVKAGVLALGEVAEGALDLPISANVDLAKVRPYAVLLGSVSPQMGLSGQLSAPQLNISSEKQVVQVATRQARIKDLKVTYPQQAPFEQSEVEADFEIIYDLAEKSFAIKSLRLTSPQIKIHKAQVEQVRKAQKKQLQGSVEAEYDFEAVSTLAGPYLPKGLRIKGKRKQEINFISEYPADEPQQMWANLSTKTKFGFDEAEYMGLVFGAVETDIQFQNGRLTVAPFSTTVNNGKVNLAANADFNREPALLTNAQLIKMRDIQINDATTSRLLMYVNPIFAEAIGVSGVVNFSCERLAIPLAGASRDDLQVLGTIAIDNLQLRPGGLLGQIISLMGAGSGVYMKIHPTRFALQKGYLRYDDMQLDVGDNPVNFKGVIGLDKTLDMKVTLPYTLSGLTARVGRETPGERITLPLKGTLDKPELDTEKLLEEQLKKEIFKGLEQLLK